MAGRWEFWIDRGGTFTDVVAQRPDGTLVVHKLLSDNPGATTTRRWPASGICSASPPDEPIPAERIAVVRLGTTVATNALLERKGEPTRPGHHRGFRRRAADRLPGPAADLRPARSCCPTCCTRG